jgi:hypothetical protein
MSNDTFTRIEHLAREAKALPGLKKDALLQIVNLGLAELRIDRERRGVRKLGAPPAPALQGKDAG